MKKLYLVLISLLTGCLMTSCGGTPDGNTPTPPSDGFDYKAVVNGDSTLDLSDVINKITTESGKMIRITSSDAEEIMGEIVFGDTERAVTYEAKAMLETLIDGVDTRNGDVAGYVIYKNKAGNVAVYWSDEFFREDAINAFLSGYCDLSVLYSLVPGVVTSDVASIEDRIYETAWAKVEAVASEEVVDALKKLNKFIDGSAIADWMANLWEPYICVCGKCEENGKEIACYGGAFYYANSARDYEGFLPDVESTRQALGRLATNGAFEKYGNSYANALPESVKAKLIKFCQSLQDKESGYFYHPQWGDTVGAARRGRDLGHAIDLLSALGSKPLYPTALDNLSGVEDTSAKLTKPLGESAASAVSAVKPTSAFEESLVSEEKYLEWLYANTKDIKINTQGAHTLASVRSQIKAAGYLDITMEYLDAKLRENYDEMKAAYDADPENNPPPTGLWQKTVDYSAVWGLLKLYGFYNATNRALPYPVEAMRTCVGAIMIDADEGGNYHMNDVYNQWGAPNNIIRNAKLHHPELVDELYAIAKENAAAMINETIAKLAKFRQEDGTYGYNQGTSAPYTQGTYVSLGLPEGDVNAVALAMDTYNCVFKVLGLEDIEVKLCDYRDGERFIETVSSLSSTDKIPLANDKPIDFDNTPTNMSSSINSGGSIEYITDPKDESNNVLKYTTFEGKGDSLIFKTSGTDDNSNLFIFEAKLCVTSANIAYLYQIYFGECYMIDVLYQDGKIKLRENATASSTTHTQILDGSAELGEWFKVRVEYYVDAENPTIIVYFNDRKVIESHRYTDSHIEGAKPKNVFETVKIWAMKRATADMLLDDVYVACKTKTGE